jgi:two-component system, NarL family, sensor kinase
MSNTALPKPVEHSNLLRKLNPDRSEPKNTETRPRDLSVRLIQAQDQEQRRIARELHDCTGQAIAILKMNLDRLGKVGTLNAEQAACLSESEALVDAMSVQLRTISYLLHPPLLDEIGLVSALRGLVEGFSQRSGIEARLSIDEDFSELPSEVEISIYRIVQECLTNIHRHSGSPTARIRVEQLATEIEIEVQDDGRGIPSEIIANGRSVGLFGIQERAKQLGGSVQIDSNGKGATVLARLPISKGSAIAKSAAGS